MDLIEVVKMIMLYFSLWALRQKLEDDFKKHTISVTCLMCDAARQALL